MSIKCIFLWSFNQYSTVTIYPFCITEGKQQPVHVSDNLKQVALTLLNRTTCRDQIDGYRYAQVVTDKMICASRGINGQGVCQVSDVVRNLTGNLWLFHTNLMLLGVSESATVTIFCRQFNYITGVTFWFHNFILLLRAYTQISSNLYAPICNLLPSQIDLVNK